MLIAALTVYYHHVYIFSVILGVDSVKRVFPFLLDFVKVMDSRESQKSACMSLLCIVSV